MQMKPVNPWDWSDKFGFSQAVEVTGATRTLYCAGQTSVDAEGNPIHPGNMEAQLAQAFDNLETVLAAAGMTLANVVRLNYYVTDIPASHPQARRQTVSRKPAARRRARCWAWRRCSTRISWWNWKLQPSASAASRQGVKHRVHVVVLLQLVDQLQHFRSLRLR
jgi:enamine deaminase RidA (YjgF/YER057c/UK114 family)